MNQSRLDQQQLRGRTVGTACFVLLFIFFAGAESFAQEQACQVGTRVELKGGSTGTIAEIGTERPHVGWYRITFSWSPQGEWYDPRTWEMHIAGSNTKCTTEPASNKSQPQNQKPEARSPQQAVSAGSDGQGSCPLTEPPGKVLKTSPASAQLFKRVIYERAAAKIDPASVSAPKKIGLTFLAFEMGKPYENTLTSSRFGDKRKHDGAPEGAMIYPVKTTELQCDLHGNEVRRSVTEVNHDCFKNRSGEWTCPGRTVKTIESRLIPLK